MVYRWIRVIFGAASSSFLSNAVIKHHFKQLVKKSEVENEVEAAELLLTSMYVDDVLGAVDSISQAIRMVETISKIY